ncbi:MAG TPA: heavy metal response regulator transcription factor [Desulfuromonadales bacterium]|jgi:two-component system copper resistance phosphate regulon response regulator CusR|nr:heavy metal response regulator transcription factor [Desulfuromonadales bacterium]
MYLLIIEDEEKATEQLKKGLAEANVFTDVANNGLQGLILAQKKEYDLILLDVMLPGASGWEVLKKLRAGGSSTPVIMLTALDSVSDRVMGLQLGADDYLIKPFAFSELLARIQSVLRRGIERKPDLLRVADLEVDFFSHSATRGGKRLDLTKKEFALLSLLIHRTGEALSRDRIAERIWNLGFDSNLKIVDVKIGNLRVKVDDPFEKKLIHTVRGFGYVLEDRDEGI